MYNELKNKGMEFPAPELESVVPIYTPQRVSVDCGAQFLRFSSLLLCGAATFDDNYYSVEVEEEAVEKTRRRCAMRLCFLSVKLSSEFADYHHRGCDD